MSAARSPRCRLAVRTAREAALMIRTTAGPRRVLRLKSSAYDLVTETDLRVERYVRNRIASAYPGDAIVGEEAGPDQAFDLSAPTWFVDPVDGTTNFVLGLPLVASNLAFCDGGVIQVGVTADVMRTRIYWTERDRGAWLGRTRLSVSSTPLLSRAVLSTGFPYSRASSDDNNLAEVSRLVPRIRDLRRLGCAGLDLAWVASGLLDGYWEQQDGPWDWATGALLVREAGGRVTTYDGKDWTPGDPTLVATNGVLHDELLDHIDAARRPVYV